MLVMVSGKKGSGKDTMYSMLAQAAAGTGIMVRRIALADKLKELCVELFGLDKACVYGTDADKNKLTKYTWKRLPTYRWYRHFFKRNRLLSNREFLQQFGTEICRFINPDCWVDFLLLHYKYAINDNSSLYLCVDCRFENEISHSKDTGAYTVRLLRSISDDKHISEIALDNYQKFDYVIDNKDEKPEETFKKFIVFILKDVLKGIHIIKTGLPC